MLFLNLSTGAETYAICVVLYGDADIIPSNQPLAPAPSFHKIGGEPQDRSCGNILYRTDLAVPNTFDALSAIAQTLYMFDRMG